MDNNTSHPSAEYIHDILKKADSNISLATVYRNLNKMAAAGQIRKIFGLEDKAHFDYNTSEHYHFICEKCGKVYDLPCDIAPDIVQNTKNKTGFQINSHEIVFHGICLDCKKKERQ